MPIQRLFARRDRRTYPGAAMGEIVGRADTFLGQSQFRVEHVSPTQLHAEQYYQKLGLRRVVDLWFQEDGGNVTVTMDFSATLGDGEAVVGLVGALVWLPLTVAVGAVSYLDYQRDADTFAWSFWKYLGSSSAPYSGARCGNCGLELDRDSSFCKRCGAKAQV
ncbi:zinc ribbon domain-containing protein [Methanomassiliicoccus luminyensis]|uniref:zinc ribbon domain-containing protein n=1 Tax=Methanomassiliicoccus luminyensis TaxID=1080712 RepID=UPI0003739F46|nr:zinc ribbon domain-containing protein [Methanomassiliicoccus luminyensis]